MKKLRLFLIPWTLFLVVHLTTAQRAELPDINASLRKLTYQPHRPLYELIPPLDGFRALHQAVAITPPPVVPHIDPLAVLGMTPSPIFNRNNKFITVTVPNPLYQPDASLEGSNSVPVAVLPPIVNDKKVDNTQMEPLRILEGLPRALSATLFNGTKDDSFNKELPNIGGFQSSSQSTADVKDSSDIDITKLNEEIENLNSSGQSEEINLPETDSTTTTTVSTTAETTPSTTSTSTTTMSTPTTTSTASTSLPLSTTSESSTTTSTTASTFHLSEQLENKNIGSFLAAANISTNEAHNFLMLVEKVLEEEVHKRLQQHVEETQKTTPETSTTPTTTVKTTKSPTTVVLTTSTTTDVQPSLDISEPLKLVNDELVPSNPIRKIQEKVEVKTVDTRLSYGSELSEQPEVEAFEPHFQRSSEEVDVTDQQPKHNITENFGKPVLAIREHIMPLPRVTSSDSRDSQVKNFAAQAGVLTEDFKEREQADFDSLIGRGQARNVQVQEKINIEPTTTTSTIPPWKNTYPPVNHIHSGTRPPMTQFERLVKDYQFRLSGQNGFNDLIKALRNAKIGFYERPTYNRYHKRPRQ